MNDVAATKRVVTPERRCTRYMSSRVEHNLCAPTFRPRSASRGVGSSRRMSRGGSRWRQKLIRVASRKCSTSPQCGYHVSLAQPPVCRTNFPLDPVPAAGSVVKLAPFRQKRYRLRILERPGSPPELDGEDSCTSEYVRGGSDFAHLTPMGSTTTPWATSTPHCRD